MKRPSPRLLTSEGERVATLEVKFEGMETRLEGIDTKVSQLHNVFLGAKAIRWLILGLVSISASMAAIMAGVFAVIKFATGH